MQESLKKDEEKDIESITVLTDAWFGTRDQAEISRSLVNLIVRNAFSAGQRSQLSRRLKTESWVEQKKKAVSGLTVKSQ